MRRYSLAVRRLVLALSCTVIASLSVVASAQAIVVNDAGTEAGVAMVPAARVNPLPNGVTAVTSAGPCTDPWLSTDLGAPFIPRGGLCYRSGPVIHKNETFAVAWDQGRAYWSETRGYEEQFLRDVADASGSLGSPFSDTQQYNDSGGRALNASVFGGGCIDYGVTGGSNCDFGTPNAAGHDYPGAGAGCTAAGDSFVDPGQVNLNGVCLTDAQIQGEVAAMVNQEGLVGRTQAGYTPLVDLLLPAGVESCLDTSNTLCSANGNLTPPPALNISTSPAGGTIPAADYRVVTTYLIQKNGQPVESAPSGSQTITTTGGLSTITIPSPPAPPQGITVDGWYAYVTQPNGSVFTRQGGLNQIGSDLTLNAPMTGSGSHLPQITGFCSYHSQVNVNGTEVAYVVQPWSAGTGCDEPDAPQIPPNPTPHELAIGVGQRLVSPLSQSNIAAIVNPGLNGWAALDGSEIEDDAVVGNNGYICQPLANQADKVTLGTSSQNPYYLQREFNNAGALEFDPATYWGCAPDVILSPEFVVPSAVDQGDVIELDGAASASTLMIPQANYQWNFGDGTTAVGPSVEHGYNKGGTYNITLTLTDRGGYTSTVSQTVQVLGATGQPVPPPSSSSGGGGSGSGSGSSSGPGLNVHLQLLPQSLKAVLRNGILVRVSSNKAANGIATVTITRRAARKAGIKVGRAGYVRIGLGTVNSITNGTVTLRLHLSPVMAKKLSHLHHVAMTIRLALVSSANDHFAVDAAGKY
jgi:hypothetical protein